MRRVTILGSTGSIGCNTVDLIANAPGDYDVVAVTGGRNIARLAEQARRLDASVAVTAHDDCLEDLRAALKGTDIECAAGRVALCEAAARPADWSMSAIVGAAGLAPGLEAVKSGGTLALANKESLVCAGALLLAQAERADARILPVDSEHSAVFQALTGEATDAVERVVITASGGAFRDWPTERLKTATVEQASAHPNWDMGTRITIDSASLFNKALELIETHEYFGFEPDQIEAVIHPESLIHALVGFTDGALMAHLGPPDMRHAIAYALHWPERRHVGVERLDLAQIGQLTFREPDSERYPALRLAREVMEADGLAGAVFNAAKERALDGFIGGEITFLDMAAIVEDVLAKMAGDSHMGADMTLETVMQADREARRVAGACIEERQG